MTASLLPRSADGTAQPGRPDGPFFQPPATAPAITLRGT